MRRLTTTQVLRPGVISDACELTFDADIDRFSYERIAMKTSQRSNQCERACDKSGSIGLGWERRGIDGLGREFFWFCIGVRGRRVGFGLTWLWPTRASPAEESAIKSPPSLLTEGRDQVLDPDQVADALQVVGQDREVDFRCDLPFPAAEEVVIAKGAFDRTKAMFDDRFAPAQ